MRPSNHPRSRASSAACALALFAALAAGCHGPMREHHHARHHGFTSDTSTIQIVTTELGGKNVFIPSTIVVTSGHPVKLSIFNTTKAPHGFSIPALGVSEVLPAQEEHEIALGVLEPNQVLQIICHLHSAHRTATLVVLPARKAKGEHSEH
jgi:Cupredoxin-like domain